MTVSTDKAKETFTGTGSQSVFPCSFRIFDEEDVEVTVDGTVQTLNTDYEVDNITDSGFDVDFSISTDPANDASVVVVRDLDFVQETDYREADPFPAASHEDALDLLTMIAQQLNEASARTLKASLVETEIDDLPEPANRRNKFLKFEDTSEANPTAVSISDLDLSLATELSSLAKGDLLLQNSSNVWKNLSAGADNSLLVADSGETLGAKWQTLSALIAAIGNIDFGGAVLGGHNADDIELSGATNLNAGSHRGAVIDLQDNTLTIVANSTTSYGPNQQAVVWSSHASGGTVTVPAGVTLNGVDNGSATVAQGESFGLYQKSTDNWWLFNAEVA